MKDCLTQKVYDGAMSNSIPRLYVKQIFTSQNIIAPFSIVRETFKIYLIMLGIFTSILWKFMT